jgi:hypothetical protein
MADDSDRESYVVEKVLAQDGGRRRQLRLGLVRAGSKRYLEARVYFENNMGEMSPTRKGVVFTASNFLTLVRTVNSESEEMRKWLGLTFTPEDVLADASRVASRGPSRSMPNQITWAFVDGSRAGMPFFVEEHGACLTVNFNSQHSWVWRRLQGLDEAAMRIVAELVASEEIARRFARFNSENDEFEGVLELLENCRSFVLDSSRER